MKLKPNSPKLEKKLSLIQTTIESLKQNQNERWKNIRLITKQQQQNAGSAIDADPYRRHSQDDSTVPVWTQRMDTLFGPINDQLRLIKCDSCGIITRETNSKVGVTHKLNCEMLKKCGSYGVGVMSKKFGSQFSNLESNSKKRASSEVSLDSTNLPIKKKKKTTIIDHTQPMSSGTPGLGHESDALSSSHPHVFNGIVMTKKQIKKALAAAERLERENERKEKKRLEEEARKAKKLSRAKGGPVNVNEQCGVLIPPNDIPCARSLTCKTHSMGAKRSVPGRSAPYDVLLNEWQKKHNPNWGDRKVVTPRVGPGIEPGLSKKKKKELALANRNLSNDNNDGMSPSNNKNSEANGSHNKSGQFKDKDKSNGSNQQTKSNNASSKTGPGAHGHNQANSSKKSSSSHNQSKADNRTISEKISAINEAKLLGEVDDDFYLIIPPASGSKGLPKKSTKQSGLSGARPTVDGDGDTAMESVGPEGMPHKTQHDVGQNEGVDDDDDELLNESDVEVDLVIKGLIVAQNSLRPATLLNTQTNHHSRNPFGTAYLLHSNGWSKFGKLGVKESFKSAFKVN